MRRFGAAAIAAMTLWGLSMAQPASAASSTPTSGDEATQTDTAMQWFLGQRAAPNDATSGDAYAAAASTALPATSGSWTERTRGYYFTDSPTYAPVGASCGANCFQNSGSGERYVGGRMTAVAAAAGGDLFAGGADGGLWKSTDQGASWTPVGDNLGTLSIGALLIDNTDKGYTVYAGTGESNTNSDSYAGLGVYESSNGGKSWTLLPSSAVDTAGSATVNLNGANVFRLLLNGGYLYAATSHGLYRIVPGVDGQWTRVLAFDSQYANGTTLAPNLRVWDMITDVVALPGAGHLLAAAGWRAGEPTNGLYETTDGGNTFTFLANPQGFVPAQQQGRITLATSAAGDRIYSIVQNANAFVHPDASGTILAGIYESASGNPNGAWNQIASPDKLASSGSAEARAAMRGYKPGVQAWYNQFLVVDPNNADHVYAGLEEVYETANAGTDWNAVGPYWNLTLQCFSYQPFEGTCDHNQTHPDQHAAFIDSARGLLYVGNDGGIWSRSLSDPATGHWKSLNLNLNTLQFYAAAGTNDGNFYGGLQDNGTARNFPSQTTVVGDTGTPVAARSVQVFGGDGGYTLVDPNNVNNVITEYVDLTSARSNDGGQTWVGNAPPDTSARFIAPIVLDHTLPVDGSGSGHVLAGGAHVWDSTKGFNTNSGDWQNIYDLTQGGTYPSRVATAIGTATAGGVTTTWVAWCGPCNPSFATGGGFRSGVVELSNSGGAYHLVSSVVTGGTSGLPRRYITGVYVDTNNPQQAYITFSGYSRHWVVGPEDPGVGHVYQLTSGGSVITGTDVSGNLTDAPANDVIVVNGDLVVGNDFGVYVSKLGSGTWSRLGGNLPNAVVDQLGVYGGQLMAATHGRGIWTLPVSSLP
ncbi:MAG TPA: hypothetical protein VF134_05415 [Candidatus Dormibacteraeota bacterium]